MHAMMTSGVDHEPHSCTEYPTTRGLSDPPRLPSVFSAPVIVPAASPPMSWHIAQLGLKHKSAKKNATAMSTAARSGCGTDAAARMKIALNGIATAPIDRPTFNPYRFVNRSVSHPPVMVAAPPVSSTALDNHAAC